MSRTVVLFFLELVKKMDATDFGVRLKELRTAAGLTQPALAEKAGKGKDGKPCLTQAAIAKIEQGLRSPAWGTVVTLCKALGVKCDAFLEEPAASVDQGRGRPKAAEAAADAKPAKRKSKRT